MSEVTAFLRRTSASPSRTEYLYFTAETYDFNGDDRMIAPQLPGTTVSNVKGGSSSPNFLFDIGSRKISIRVLGTLVEIATAQYPDVGASGDVYVYESGITATRATQTADEIRETLIDFWVAQSDTNYSAIELGWPLWGASDDSTIHGNTYRIWQGLMRQPKTTEVSGEPLQFYFAFNFEVGNSS